MKKLQEIKNKIALKFYNYIKNFYDNVYPLTPTKEEFEIIANGGMINESTTKSTKNNNTIKRYHK